MTPVHVIHAAIGEVTVHWNPASGMVSAIDLPGTSSGDLKHWQLADLPPPARTIVEELTAYLNGKPVDFSFSCIEFPGSTEFTQAVYQAVAAIPAGETLTYGQVAEQVGHPGAARAVGTAMSRNPVPLVVPCHRVVATHGLGGFGGGLDRKRQLLDMEASC